jgi:hypothetical protein
VIHRPPLISDRRKLDNFFFEIGLNFAFRDERLEVPTVLSQFDGGRWKLRLELSL